MSIPQPFYAIIKNEPPYPLTSNIRFEGLTPLELAYALQRKEWVRSLSSSTSLQIEFEGALYPPGPLFERLGLTYTPYLCFKSYKHLRSIKRWIGRTFPIQTLQEKWEALLYKEELLQGSFAPVRLQLVNTTIGYGLYAREKLNKGTFITEYTGELIHNLSQLFRSNDYLWEYSNESGENTPYQINPKKIGNLGRFINHSDQYNAVPKATIVNGFLRIFFIAIKTIHKDQQISVNYGPKYWRKRRKLPN